LDAVIFRFAKKVDGFWQIGDGYTLSPLPVVYP